MTVTISSKASIILALLLISSKTILSITESELPAEQALVRKLLGQYAFANKYAPPIYVRNEPIFVDFHLSLMSIIDLNDNENQQTTLTVHCWLSQVWKDPLLSWNPSNSSGIDEVGLPVKQIWTPDVTLYNGVYMEQNGDKPYASVKHDGTVSWVLSRTLTVICDRANEDNYPFDELQCLLKFGSWTLTGAKVRLLFSGASNEMQIMASSKLHPAWQVVDKSAVRNEVFYQCCPDVPFVDLSYTLKLKRTKTLSCFLPLFPLFLLGVFISAPFIIPGNTTIKVETAIMTFFALLIYGLVIIFMAPLNRNHHFVFCYQLELCSAALAIITSAWISEIRSNKTKPPPSCLAKACNALACLLLCRCASRRESPTSATAMALIRSSMALTNRLSNNNNAGNDEAVFRAETARNRAKASRHDWNTIAAVLNVLAALIFTTANLTILYCSYPTPP